MSPTLRSLLFLAAATASAWPALAAEYVLIVSYDVSREF